MRPKVFLFLLALMLAAASPVLAQLEVTPPAPRLMLWDMQRWSFGVGADYEFTHATGIEPTPPFEHEWNAGLFAAWSATPHTGISTSAVYGFDNKLVRWTGEARLSLNPATDPIAFQLGAGYVIYDAAGAATPPTFAKEWEAALHAGKIVTRLNKQTVVILGASGYYGLDNQRTRLEIAARLGHTLNKGGY